ncbi:MAG: SRPBCC family protein [Solirubrobacteraceae bacterium]|nr:SRPBCC family protein [Solirubrobacteraceae bacterium]
MGPIAASRPIAAPPPAAYALLADLRAHWALADHWTEVRALGDDGGTIRLRGPLGIRRTVRVRVRRRVPPRELDGIAELGRATRAEVRWLLEPDGAGGTLVTLSARVLRAGLADRLLLALGARRWLAWRFAVTLRRMDLTVRSDGERYERISAN